jgi:hypothetical protein
MPGAVRCGTATAATSLNEATATTAAAVRPAADVWAVGATSQVGDVQAVAVHWNGRSGAHNIWAVGNANSSSTLIVHWNGKAWSA